VARKRRYNGFMRVRLSLAGLRGHARLCDKKYRDALDGKLPERAE